jgi:hypothetical protein
MVGDLEDKSALRPSKVPRSRWRYGYDTSACRGPDTTSNNGPSQDLPQIVHRRRNRKSRIGTLHNAGRPAKPTRNEVQETEDTMPRVGRTSRPRSQVAMTFLLARLAVDDASRSFRASNDVRRSAGGCAASPRETLGILVRRRVVDACADGLLRQDIATV